MQVNSWPVPQNGFPDLEAGSLEVFKIWRLTLQDRKSKVKMESFHFIFIVDTITGVPIFFPSAHLLPAPSPLPSLWPSPHCCLRVMHMCSLANPFAIFHPVLPSPPLWQLSVCSMYLCLCVYFVRQFVLFIRFHIEVRSYGICLPLTGLLRMKGFQQWSQNSSYPPCN